MSSKDRRRATATSIALTLGLLCGTATSVHANDGDGDSDDRVAFVRTNLVSNIDGRARVTDAHLQNAWGIAFAPGNPFWVNDNHAGVATLYAGDGSIGYPGSYDSAAARFTNWNCGGTDRHDLESDDGILGARLVVSCHLHL